MPKPHDCPAIKHHVRLQARYIQGEDRLLHRRLVAAASCYTGDGEWVEGGGCVELEPRGNALLGRSCFTSQNLLSGVQTRSLGVEVLAGCLQTPYRTRWLVVDVAGRVHRELTFVPSSSPTLPSLLPGRSGICYGIVERMMSLGCKAAIVGRE